MKTGSHKIQLMLTALFATALLLPGTSEAQRMKHSAPAAASRPQAAKSSGGAQRSINGGAKKSESRQVAKAPSGGDRSASRESAGKNTNVGNNVNAGNKVNVDNSKKNVNINVDNSKNVNVQNNRNTVVRAGGRPYGRPPYAYGGRRYYCHGPYYYHPYRPYYWGPVYHPWGFFAVTLATTAVVLSVQNQQYHYDQGVYYVAGNGGYTVVSAPVGATITTLPQGSQTVVVNETTNNYYYGGTYYEKSGSSYTVVAPTAGTVVESLPDGGEEVRVGEITYVKVGETYYQPIQEDGKDKYEVVKVEEEGK